MSFAILKPFKLYTEYNQERYYLGAMRQLITDKREDPGPTTFVSAGTSADYKEFLWTLDSEGRLTIASSPTNAALPQKSSMLAAHRTFTIDIRGNCETYLITTIFDKHEGLWKLDRVGSLDRQRCVI